MKSFACCKCVVALLALCNMTVACANPAGPQAIRDPVFGLSFPLAHTRLAPLPADVMQACPALVNDQVDRHSWIFAQADGPDGRYYVVGGYFERHLPLPKGLPRFERDDRGVMFKVAGEQCALIGPAAESFMALDDNGPAAPILASLATDLRRRLGQGVHGDQKVMRAVHRGSANLLNKSAALQAAFGRPGRSARLNAAAAPAAP